MKYQLDQEVKDEVLGKVRVKSRSEHVGGVVEYLVQVEDNKNVFKSRWAKEYELKAVKTRKSKKRAKKKAVKKVVKKAPAKQAPAPKK